MIDREKVIRGLELCSREPPMTIGCLLDCPYDDVDGCKKELMRQALALLKAQEPRVMTLEEAKAAYVIEYRSGNMKEVGASLLDIGVDPANEYYGEIYRVWTSRPTDAQREATPWDG